MWWLFEKWLCMFWDLINWCISTIYLAYASYSIRKHLHGNQRTRINRSLRKKGGISTEDDPLRMAWTTVITLPPNFIPFRPAQALRVTDWSTYWCNIRKSARLRRKGNRTFNLQRWKKMKKNGSSITIQNEQW